MVAPRYPLWGGRGWGLQRRVQCPEMGVQSKICRRPAVARGFSIRNPITRQACPPRGQQQHPRPLAGGSEHKHPAGWSREGGVGAGPLRAAGMVVTGSPGRGHEGQVPCPGRLRSLGRQTRKRRRGLRAAGQEGAGRPVSPSDGITELYVGCVWCTGAGGHLLKHGSAGTCLVPRRRFLIVLCPGKVGEGS